MKKGKPEAQEDRSRNSQRGTRTRQTEDGKVSAQGHGRTEAGTGRTGGRRPGPERSLPRIWRRTWCQERRRPGQAAAGAGKPSRHRHGGAATASRRWSLKGGSSGARRCAVREECDEGRSPTGATLALPCALQLRDGSLSRSGSRFHSVGTEATPRRGTF